MTDDPTLSARLHAKQGQIRATAIEDMTLADRLTRRALDQRITIDLGDENDSIPVEIRVPTFTELDRLGVVQAMMTSGTIESVSEYAALSAEFADLVGGLCTDPSLGPEFWASGLFGTEVIAIIKESAQDAARERVEQARAFRQAAGGKGAAAVRGTVRKNAK